MPMTSSGPLSAIYGYVVNLLNCKVMIVSEVEV